MAQINPRVGDFKGNRDKILSYIDRARKFSPDFLAFPELCITGYPPEDLLLKPGFIAGNLKTLYEIRDKVGDMVVAVGFVDRRDDIYNAAALLYNKEIIDIYHKMFLPNYGVFDENRYFQSGDVIPIYNIGGVMIGVNICEDIWYPGGPIYEQTLAGAELIVNINASPYNMGKTKYREIMLSTRAVDNSVIIAYLNTVGGQDELVFDGGSMVVDQTGEVKARADLFKEELTIVDLDIDAVFMSRLRDPRRRQEVRRMTARQSGGRRSDRYVNKIFIHDYQPSTKPKISPSQYHSMTVEEEVYNALVLGLSDYVGKNGFKNVIIGLSGGIDSAIVAAIAADALGCQNVTVLFMPSVFTSTESREDANELACNLGVKLFEIPVKNIYNSYISELSDFFKDTSPNETEENLQARIRGNLLMAFSNKFGSLVLTTGNKSEMSVGYATLYGDMAGGFAVIKDVPKILVYELALWRNKKAGKPFIPVRIITKAPTAELRDNQKDTDTLPPYELLDPVLKAYVENEMHFEEIVSLGFNEATVKKVIDLIDKNEYKRRQAPPGIKITRKAFGKDRRFPITNSFSILKE